MHTDVVLAAIYSLADEINMLDSYIAMKQMGSNTPSLVRNIVYDIFVHGEHELTETGAYLTIKNYAKELHKNGFVK